MVENTQNKTLVLIDFDGTITKKDSFLDFILFSNSKLTFLIKSVQSLQFLIAYKFKFISPDKTKEKIFSIFFKNQLESFLIEKGKFYCENQLKKILREDALTALSNHVLQNHFVCVVTASPKYWIQPWCEKYNYDLICTEYETKFQKLTGNFCGKNCRNAEKVVRILSKYTLDNYEEIICYGDTPDDVPMLNLGTKKFYKTFFL